MQNSHKIKLLEQMLPWFNHSLGNCTICPRNCGVNRLNNETGICRTGNECRVYTSFLHHGEEPPISGTVGSGTIFFSGCNLRCLFCQNHKFSHDLLGTPVTSDELADTMLNLQEQNAHNINLVTPTHVLPQILKALLIAYSRGFDLPVVYNTSGYEKTEVIEKLDGIVDIYLTDVKYISSDLAGACSKAPDYFEYCRESVLTMYDQRRPVYKNGMLSKGVIIRHLVLPGQLENSKQILQWIKDNMPDVLVSVMFQYQPYGNAKNNPELGRRITLQEYTEICDYIRMLDLGGWVQDFNPPDDLAGVHFEQTIR